jgi:CMP-N-acetylneuraminic acid synthetase
MNKNRKIRIYAMIPARFGSTRLKLKNLALIDGEPMVGYAIKAAKKSGIFEKIILNSEHEIFSDIATRYGIDFYHRPDKLGGSSIKADEVVHDFLESYPEADIVVWVNPTSPFQTGKEIFDACTFFMENGLDSLITVENKSVHSMFNGEPINYKVDEVFSQTQDLMPVQNFVYSSMIWKSELFCEKFKQDGHAFFCGKFGVFPVSKKTGIIIKNEEDLMIVDLMMKHLKKKSKYFLKYDELAEKFLKLLP